MSVEPPEEPIDSAKGAPMLLNVMNKCKNKIEGGCKIKFEENCNSPIQKH